ncbi:GNAT family acetyltransferase, partial [Dehalococcoides mccartyi]|nr:GNAT family acetyltransferase [Dehalococcoides mccartyi]
ELFLVALESNAVIGTVMAGYEGHRGWINYLAVDPEIQRGSIGSQLMSRAESLLKDLGCVKINLQVRSTNEGVLGFYDSIGYSKDDVVSMGKRLS